MFINEVHLLLECFQEKNQRQVRATALDRCLEKLPNESKAAESKNERKSGMQIFQTKQKSHKPQHQ